MKPYVFYMDNKKYSKQLYENTENGAKKPKRNKKLFTLFSSFSPQNLLQFRHRVKAANLNNKSHEFGALVEEQSSGFLVRR